MCLKRLVRIIALWGCVLFQTASMAADGDVLYPAFIHPPQFDTNCTVNAWTKPTSGHWEEPFWSCGHLPAPDQYLIAITNEGSKRVTIDGSTTAQFPDSLTPYNLLVDAPEGSVNRLVMMYAGTNVPLTAGALTLGMNGTLTSFHSALTAWNLYVNSSALFAERSLVQVSHISVAGNLTLMDSATIAGLISLQKDHGVVNQFGGSSRADLVAMDAESSFRMEGGKLSIQNLYLEYNGFPVQVASGQATFVQAGGETAIEVMRFGTPVVSGGRHGEYLLQGGWLTCSNMAVYNGVMKQSNGVASTQLISLPAWQDCEAGYNLSGGTLVSARLSMGAQQTYALRPGNGHFGQSGGIHRNGSMSLSSQLMSQRRYGFAGVTPLGFYTLTAGLLVSSNVAIGGGSFYQEGGTAYIHELGIGSSGDYWLADGELFATKTMLNPGACGWNYYFKHICYATTFTQEGGRHVVENLEIQGVAQYQFTAGRLVAGNIIIRGNSELNCERGVVRNWGTFTISGGVFRAGGGSHRLGQLEVQTPGWQTVPPTDEFSIYVGEGVIRFRDSRDVVWSGARLNIRNWAGGPGRIFVGNDSHGLSEEQLSKVVFVNPAGWPPGIYPARLLATGELQPAVAPPVLVTRGAEGLVLSWPGEYDLLSATNVMGPYLPVPGAISPMRITCAGPQRYFRLAVP